MAKTKKPKKKSVKKSKKPAPFKLRSNVRLKGLNPANVPRVRKELVEVDYLKNLNLDEKKWLAQFTDEYVSGSVQKDSKGHVKKGYLHNTKELAKDCYDSNNRRNNDVHGVTKANGLLYNIDQISHDKDGWYVTNKDLTEDAVIAQIEREDENDVLSFEEYLKLQNILTPEVREYYKTLYAEKLK